MSLNPVQFGTQVVDQFGRYLLSQFPIADQALEKQIKAHLRHGASGQSLLHKGPFVHLSRPFEPGPSVKAMIDEKKLGLHPHLANVFPFETVHKHQELALRSILASKHTVMSTGTGSGKTEGFLMPIINHCLHRRDEMDDHSGVVAVLVYPMNALVNDQLERLRPLLAGSRITFGRYTGETTNKAEDSLDRLDTPRPYTAREKKRIKEKGALILPWEECFTRDEIRSRKPNLLLTNYTMLEYMLLRDNDLDLLRDAPLRFFVFDEVHTYTSALGSEVACLIRRLRQIAGKGPDDIISIGTSATVTDERDAAIDGKKVIGEFCHRLFGVDRDKVELITEQYQVRKKPEGSYSPPMPKNMLALMQQILETANEDHLKDTPEDINLDLIPLAEKLCGRAAPKTDTNMERLFKLLEPNDVVLLLSDWFGSPSLFDEAVAGMRRLPDRAAATDDEIRAEMLAYLTLGALAQYDDEPLLRPKLHYFIQGYQGLKISFEPDGPVLHVDDKNPPPKADGAVFPLLLCRNCGQHYVRLIMDPEEATEDGGDGHRVARVPDRWENPKGEESFFTFTNELHTQIDDTPVDLIQRKLCRMCGAVHPIGHTGICKKCGVTADNLIPVEGVNDEMRQCAACGTGGRGKSDTIIHARSGDVGDITIVAQSMLAAMTEPALQKLLIFADSRQEAAFQAGWMEERGKRFRLRHLLYQLLHEHSRSSPMRFDRLVEKLLDKAQDEGILPRHAHGDTEDEEMKVRWFLDDEFASMSQRRRNLEALGMAFVEYDGLSLDSSPTFFNEWAGKLGITSEGVVDIARLLLDVYRQNGAMSDPLLRRWWTSRDREVRKGLVSPGEWQAPQVIVFEKSEEQRVKKYRLVKGWLASNGRSFSQVLVKKGTGAEPDERDKFLSELWEWLIDNEILVPVEIVQRRQKKIVRIAIEGGPYQVNVEKIGVRESSHRVVCSACRRAHSVPLPLGNCPEYFCRGTTETTGRDDENYDVVQFTRTAFVPLKSYEHSAQVPNEKRKVVEREFKREDGDYNTLVCTPTLELGVDIGKLEMAMMRNVPPTPANYAQRAGRAGRKHRIAAVFTYCRGSQHDRYFFEDPPSMIAGDIRVPSFSLQNAPLIRKHTRSLVLTLLRNLISDDEQQVLTRAFPSYLWSWLGDKDEEGRFRNHNHPPDFFALGGLIEKYKNEVFSTLESTFRQNWPDEDRHAVEMEKLQKHVEEFATDLSRLVHRLFAEIKAYREERGKLYRMQQDGVELTKTEEIKQRQFSNILRDFQEEDQAHYALSWLCQNGFFPGYALTRESISAQCIEPYIDLSRPSAIAIRELTPGAWVYANKQVFQVHRMAFNKLKVGIDNRTAESIHNRLRYDSENDRVYDPTHLITEGGDKDHFEFDSYEMIDVELKHEQEIDDTSDARRRVAYSLHGSVLPQHMGGYEAKIGTLTLLYLRRAEVRLVNLGPMKFVGRDQPDIGFPICPACGETRNPFASDREKDTFAEFHKKFCKVDTLSAALHVDLDSDVIEVGPFQETADAVNFAQGLRLGCRMVLDMGDSEIDAFANLHSDGQSWAAFYDPIPGGSGFLAQIVEYWPEIVAQAVTVLSNCPTGKGCKDACYRCMKHFFNQQHHQVLDRFKAIELLQTAQDEVQHLNNLAAWKPSASELKIGETDSDVEWDFLKALEDHHFLKPDAQQYRVDFSGGSYTVADYAYLDKKVLVFIDGLSKNLHGDPRQAQKDQLNRQKARMLGYQVVEIAASAMHDEAMLALKMEELQLLLD